MAGLSISKRASNPIPIMTISYLVISKTTYLLNNLIESALESKSCWEKTDEIICSWNGKNEDIAKIKTHGLPVRIIKNSPYHMIFDTR